MTHKQYKEIIFRLDLLEKEVEKLLIYIHQERIEKDVEDAIKKGSLFRDVKHFHKHYV